MHPRCCSLHPIVDQERVLTLSVETTGPLLNTDLCKCQRCCKKRKKHRRRRRR